MIKDFTQFVPSRVCLKCDGCCRFKEADSRWRPYISFSEMKDASLPSRIFDKHAIGPDQRISTTPCASGAAEHLCYFLNPRDNACGIYHARPFECQFYPFLLGREDGKIVVYVHLNCPYAQEHWGDQSYQDYVQYLQGVFRREDVVSFLKSHPLMASDYSAFRAELDLVCSILVE